MSLIRVSDWVSDTKGKVVQNKGNVVIQTTQQDSNRFKQLNEHNQKYKRNIKALRRSNNGEDDTDKEKLYTGDKFGGKSPKKKTRFNTST